MSEQHSKILCEMLQKFRDKHGRSPEKIIVAPIALVGLAVKKSVTANWEGIPVECRLFRNEEVARRNDRAKVAYLGIFMKENRGRMVLAL